MSADMIVARSKLSCSSNNGNPSARYERHLIKAILKSILDRKLLEGRKGKEEEIDCIMRDQSVTGHEMVLQVGNTDR